MGNNFSDESSSEESSDGSSYDSSYEDSSREEEEKIKVLNNPVVTYLDPLKLSRGGVSQNGGPIKLSDLPEETLEGIEKSCIYHNLQRKAKLNRK